MSMDHLRRAIERTLLEGLPANDGSPPRTVRIEHSGTIGVRIETPEPLAAPGRSLSPSGRLIMQPAPWVRAMIKSAG